MAAGARAWLVADEIPGLRGAGRRVGSAPAVEPSNGRSCSGRDSTWTHNAAQGGRCQSCGKETTGSTVRGAERLARPHLAVVATGRGER
jgi:hypothetical protein